MSSDVSSIYYFTYADLIVEATDTSNHLSFSLMIDKVSGLKMYYLPLITTRTSLCVHHLNLFLF